MVKLLCKEFTTLAAALAATCCLGQLGGDLDGPVTGGGAPGSGGSTTNSVPMIQYQWDASVSGAIGPRLQSQGLIGSAPNLSIDAYPLNFWATPEYTATLTVKFNLTAGTKKSFRFTPMAYTMAQEQSGNNSFEDLGPNVPNTRGYLFKVEGPTTKTFTVRLKATRPNSVYRFVFQPTIVEDSRTARIETTLDGSINTPNFEKQDISESRIFSASFDGLTGSYTLPKWSRPVPTVQPDPMNLEKRIVHVGLPFETKETRREVNHNTVPPTISDVIYTFSWCYLAAFGYVTPGNGSYNFTIDGGETQAETLPSGLLRNGWDIRPVVRTTARPSTSSGQLSLGGAGKTIKSKLTYYYSDGVVAMSEVNIITHPNLDPTAPISTSGKLSSGIFDSPETPVGGMPGGFTLRGGIENQEFLARNGLTDYKVGTVLAGLLGYVPFIGNALGIIVNLTNPQIKTKTFTVPGIKSTGASETTTVVQYEQPYMEDVLKAYIAGNAEDPLSTVTFQLTTERGYDYFVNALDVWGPNGYGGRDVSVRYERWEPNKSPRKKFVLRVSGGITP